MKCDRISCDGEFDWNISLNCYKCNTCGRTLEREEYNRELDREYERREVWGDYINGV